MELDTLLTEPKWQILKIIATTPTSPVLISEEIGTSVAYVSQQLKLLEAAGIIKKVRTKAVEKGKPRLIYSIKNDIFHITALINKTPAKKKISPTLHQKIILKLWMLEKEKTIYESEKLFWQIEPFIENIQNISVDTKKSKIIIVSKEKELKAIIQKFLKEAKTIDCEIIQEQKNSEELYEIYSKENESGDLL